MRHLPLTSLGAVCLAITTAVPTRAQTRVLRETAPPITGSLSLEDAVQRGLRDAPDIRLSAQLAEVALGAAISARAVYDATVTTSVMHSRQNTLRLVPATDTTQNPSLQSSLTSSVTSTATLERRLPWGGVVISPQVSVTGAAAGGAPAQSHATTSLAFTVPLARDRFGVFSRDVADAANTEATATRHDLRQAAANGVLQIANAYWSYLGAQRRLAVAVAAEQRARQNLAQTMQLVAADERPASDLVQLRGNLSTRISSRISSEQAALEAWRTLTSLLGLGDVGVVDLPDASTDFPSLPDSASLGAPLDARERQALVDEALRRRPDLASATTRVHEMELALTTSVHLMRPVVNLVGQIGYSGLDQGSGVQHYVSPLYRNGSPLNASLQLTYQFTPTNSDAAGRYRQSAAALEQQRIAQATTQRVVATGVVAAIEGARRSITSAQAAHAATEAAQQSVKNEGRKFRLGSATALEITIADDGLTNALLAEVAASQNYATAIARLQFELGTIVVGEGGALTANVADLLRAPSVVIQP